MARGTGLPFPRDDEVIKPTPGINADAYSSAAAWGQIANAGDTIKKIGLDRFEKAKHQAEVGYLAEQETEIKRKQLELHNKYVRDPAGFDKEWSAYSQGKISETEPWAVPQVQKRLGHDGNAAYGSLLEEKRRRDEKLDAGRIKALADQSADEVMAKAMSGQLNTPEGEAALLKLRAVHASGVNADLMTPEEADLRFQNVTSRAGAESVVKIIGDTYRTNRARGLEAGPIAETMAEDMLLRTQDPRLLGLSEAERWKYFQHARSEIGKLESERKQALSLARQAARDITFAAEHGVRPNEDMVNEVVDELTAAGGHTHAAKLRGDVIRHEILRPMKGQSIPKNIDTYMNVAGAFGVHAPPAVREAIAEAAEKTGVPRSYLFSTARRESNFDPNARANTSSAGGLFQFIDSTWADMLAKHGAKHGFGPDTPKTNERANALMAGELAKENGAALKAAGLPVTDATLYLAHFAGAGGAVKLLQANPDASAADVLPGAAGANRGIFYRNDGAARTVREAIQRLTGGMVDPKAPGVDVRLLVGARDVVGSQAGDAWKKLTADMDANPGKAPDPAALNPILQAATLVGDHALLAEIEHRLGENMMEQVFRRAPLPAQVGAATELRTLPTLEHGQRRFLNAMEKMIKATQDDLEHDPIALGASAFSERIQLPKPFDLSSREAAQKGLAERVGIVRFVGEQMGDATIKAIGRADGLQLAGAIAGPDAKQTANAFDVLASIPDDNFAATLDTKEIKEAVLGAMKSNDPAKFTAAMMSLDKMWARAPQEFNKLFGDDAVKTVQDWQAKLRYHKPEELNEILKSRSREEPGVRKRREELTTEGHREAIKKTINGLADDLDPGWFVAGPDVPADARTRDIALADYVALYSERYAETRDKTIAHTQAIERMKLYWKRSEVNNGGLTLHAPETTYPAINGSHDWMKKEIIADLTALRINQHTLRAGVPADFDVGKPIAAGDFRVVADSITEGDITNKRPVSYIVMAKNRAGLWDAVRGPDYKPLRYWWESKHLTDKARDEFSRQRRDVFGRDDRGDGSEPYMGTP